MRRHRRLLIIYQTRLSKLIIYSMKGENYRYYYESLQNKGIDVVTKNEEKYPQRLLTFLKEKSPPVFFYSGDLSLLNNDGIAFVGSRDIDELNLEFTSALAKRCANEGITVVSGGARGVDQTSMKSALENGGTAIGFIADSLESLIKKPEWRKGIQNEKLILLSARSPNDFFSVGTAMERNKYIYTQSKCAIVVESTNNKGGTWAGATENLKNKWVRLYVKESNNPNSGNPKLIELGATKIDNYIINGLQLLTSLFKDSQIENFEKYRGELPVTVKVADNEQPLISNIEFNNIYEIVKSRLKYVLKKGPLTVDEIAKQLKVNNTIIKSWLHKATDEGLIIKKTKPVRYYWNENRKLDGLYGFTSAIELRNSKIIDCGKLDCTDIYPEVKKLLLNVLNNNYLSESEIAERLELENKKQLKDWVKRCMEEGLIETKVRKRQKRYKLK